METGIQNAPTPIRMTLFPPRLNLQTFWIGGHLDREMRFLRDICLAKIVYTMETNTELTFQTSWIGSTLTGKITYRRDKNSLSLYLGDFYSEHLNSCQYDTLSSQTN